MGILNVMDVSGVTNDGSTANATATRAGINTAIAQLNAQANAADWLLYFPPGRYAINNTLTHADGDYSIIMDPGAVFMYVPSDQTATGYNRVMWRIGGAVAGAIDLSIQGDGYGIVQFVLAAEGGGGGQNYSQSNNVAFEICNIRHCTVHIRRANEFYTGLRMLADATADGNKHMYDVTVYLGHFHPCRNHIVQMTRSGGWMNNIRYYNGDFTNSGIGAVTPISRYISIIQEGTIGVIWSIPTAATARGGENKATFYEPLCDNNTFTAIYMRGGSAMVHGGHMEDPDTLIEHENEPTMPAGAEPVAWIAPRLEAKQFLIIDPQDIGSYGYDPFWGPAATPRPKLLTSNRNLTVGDIRGQRMLYTEATSRVLNIVELTAGSEPPLMATVYLQRRGAGTLTLTDGSNVSVLIPTGKTASVAQGEVAVLRLIDITTGAQVWSLTGGLV